MLPPGHIAGGYLAGRALLAVFGDPLSWDERLVLVAVCAFFAFAPDLYMLYSFLGRRKFIASSGSKGSHRQYVTHTPIPWLIAGGLLILASPQLYWKMIGAAFIIGSWSHFFLDSIQYGIKWLWPISNKLYAFRDRGTEYGLSEKPFLAFWIQFICEYRRAFRLTFVLEIGIIALALLVSGLIPL